MIELQSLKKQNRRFEITLLLSYILFSTLILGGIYLLHVKLSANEAIKNFEEEIRTEASYKQTFYNKFYKKKAAAVTAISTNDILLEFIEGGKNDFKNVHSVFEMLMQANVNFMQLRYIDKNGQEIIRLDREKFGGKSTLIKKEFLQDKSDRYYHKACLLIGKNEVWFSKIDLNIEHNVIEKPIKPVLRVAHQVHIGSSLKGFVIINIFMEPYLKTLTESSIFDIYLVDKNGNYLMHKDSSKNWSRYLNGSYNIIKEFAIPKEHIANSKKFFDKDNRYFILPLMYNNYNNYKLVYFENSEKVAQKRETIRKRVLFTVLYAILIAIPFAFIAASPTRKIYKSLYKKSKLITELANNLEIKVEEEIEKNRAKNRVLENQAKLAALGEMIGNIAHQWRHPITRVSLIIQNMKTFKSMGKLSDKQFDKYTKSTLEQMDYMSQTIDDFKDFYKPDKEISLFNVSQSIKDAYKIIGASIKHEGIKISIDIKDNFSINGYKNQFSQVILNILHNAREILEEKKIKSPQIKITLFSEKNKNKVTIEDNAGGIESKHIDKVFDAYFTTKKKTGTGIGLYMSKLIMEENFKGKIDVKNSSNGALFTITLSRL